MDRFTSGRDGLPGSEPPDQAGTTLRGSRPLAERLRDHLHATSLLPAGSRCLVGLSGGGDSVALLRLLLDLRESLEISVCAAHLDHGLRPDSAADRDFVRELCRELKVPLTSARAEIRGRARQMNLSVEAAGRRVRYAFLSRVARRRGCGAVLTAHTAEDQAETILLRLIAGTGLRGLGGIRPRRRDGVIRPLLPFTRQELRDWLRQIGQPWREDPTNLVPEAPRTRVRLLLMPLLREWNPRIVQALGRLAHQAREDEACLAGPARAMLRSARRQPGQVFLDVAGLLDMPPPVRWRALRLALAGLGCRLQARHREPLEDLLAGPSGRDLDLPGGRRARRRGQELRLEEAPVAPSPPPDSFLFPCRPGSVELPGWSLRLDLGVCDSPASPDAWEIRVDPELLEDSLEIRSRRPGDRFRPAGGAGGTTLKKFLHGIGLPREERDLVPLLCCRERVVWVIGHRAAEDFLATSRSRRILRIRATRLPD